MQEYTDKRLAGFTHEQAKKAVKKGVIGTAKLAAKLEKQFTGISRPLNIEQAAVLSPLINQTQSSLLSRNASSVQRYGKAMVADFERVMRQGFVEGLSNQQVISRMVMTGSMGGIKAAKLHAKEPKYFPAPTGFVKKQYWAERIVRTETAYAYNKANHATLKETKAQDFPDMQKKILATFDSRTAPDSIAVHGQIREVDEYFMDGAGREYMHPPGRPNDRETVVPWRPEWQELPNTVPTPPKQAALAEVDTLSNKAKNALGPKALKQSMLAKVNAKKAELLAQKQKSLTAAAVASGAKQAALAAAKEGKGLAEGVEAIEAQATDVAKIYEASKKAASMAQVKKAQAALAKAKAYKEATATAKAKALAAQKEKKKAAEKKAQLEHKKAKKQIIMNSTMKGADVYMENMKYLAKSDPETFQWMMGDALGKKLSLSNIKKNWKEHAIKLGKQEAAMTDQQLAKWLPKKKVKPTVDKVVKTSLGEKLDPSSEADAWLIKAKQDNDKGALTVKASGGGYFDVYNAGAEKLSYFKKSGDYFTVTPPSTVGLSQKSFLEIEEATGYALEVSHKIKKVNEAAVKQAKAASGAKVASGAKAKAKAKAKAVHPSEQGRETELAAQAKVFKGKGKNPGLDELPEYKLRADERGSISDDAKTVDGKVFGVVEYMAIKSKIYDAMSEDGRYSVTRFTGNAYTEIRKTESTLQVGSWDDVRKKADVKLKPKSQRDRDSKNISAAIKAAQGSAIDGQLVWRGIDDVHKDLVSDWLKTGKWGNFGTSSTSRTKSVALRFGNVSETSDGVFSNNARYSPKDQVNVIFRMRNKRGVAVENMSQHERENEVLVPADSEYKITNAYYGEGSENKVVIIEGEEI